MFILHKYVCCIHYTVHVLCRRVHQNHQLLKVSGGNPLIKVSDMVFADLALHVLLLGSYPFID